MNRTMPLIGLAVLAGAIGATSTWATDVRRTGNQIVLETDHVIYAIGRDGLNKSFTDTRTGKEFLDSDPMPFMFVARDGQWTPSTALEWAGGFLRVSFADTGIRATVHPRVFANYLTFELTAINDQRVSEIQLVRLPLMITQSIGSNLVHCRDSKHAAALLPLNMETHCYVAPLKRSPPGQTPGPWPTQVPAVMLAPRTGSSRCSLPMQIAGWVWRVPRLRLSGVRLEICST